MIPDYRSMRLDRFTPYGVVLLLVIAILMLLGGGCVPRPARTDILSVTESLVGIDISQSAANNTPHIRFGYIRTQFHLVPTGKEPVYAPPVQNSMEVDVKILHQNIDEDFATGEAVHAVVAPPPRVSSARRFTGAPTTDHRPPTPAPEVPR